MSLGGVFILTALSLVAVGYFAFTDPKRRRAAKLDVLETRRFLCPARALLLAPGVYLLAAANWSGLAIWAGAVTVLGWVIAATPPHTYMAFNVAVVERAHGWRAVLHENGKTGFNAVRDLTGKIVAKWSVLRSNRADQNLSAASEIAELKARIVALEARLHRLEGGDKPPLITAEEPAKEAGADPQDDTQRKSG